MLPHPAQCRFAEPAPIREHKDTKAPLQPLRDCVTTGRGLGLRRAEKLIWYIGRSRGILCCLELIMVTVIVRKQTKRNQPHNNINLLPLGVSAQRNVAIAKGCHAPYKTRRCSWWTTMKVGICVCTAWKPVWMEKRWGKGFDTGKQGLKTRSSLKKKEKTQHALIPDLYLDSACSRNEGCHVLRYFWTISRYIYFFTFHELSSLFYHRDGRDIKLP